MSKESKITTHQIGFSLGSERGGIGCTELVQRLLMWFNRPVDGITWRTVYPTDDVGLNHPRQSPNPKKQSCVHTLLGTSSCSIATSKSLFSLDVWVK